MIPGPEDMFPGPRDLFPGPPDLFPGKMLGHFLGKLVPFLNLF